MFLAAVGLAVAAIPEGLPAIMTITLAIGVQRMAAQQRHHPPPAGRRDPGHRVGHLLGQDRHPDAQRDDGARAGPRRTPTCEVSGTGYDPHGAFASTDSDYRRHGARRRHAGAARHAAVQRFRAAAASEGDWSVQGDPMEAALSVAGIKAGLDPEHEAKALSRAPI